MKILPIALCTLGYASAQEGIINRELKTVLQPRHEHRFTASDKDNAKKSVTAIKNLADSVQETAAAEATADTVVTALDGLEAVSNVFAIAGVFLSFVELFLPDEDQMIL